MAGIPPPSMYRKPPRLNLTLDYLSEVASRRLRMLTIVEGAERREPQVLWEEFRRQGLTAYSALVGPGLPGGGDLREALREDVVSHFILRFRFCKSPVLREWFARLEWKWFKVRFVQVLSVKLDLAKFLRVNKLFLNTIMDFERKLEIRDQLVTIAGVRYMDTFVTDIYEVRFQDAPLLVRSRRCVLERGLVYFIDQQMVDYLKHVFAVRLNEDLVRLGYFEIDERINSFLSEFRVHIRTPMYASVGNIDLEISQTESVTKLLDSYSEMYYPPCMKFLHDKYKTNNHLRYFARMQYGLFIKGIGVPYEEALNFWEEGFTKKFAKDFYDKEYLYLFKHQYGKVGSKIDYPPYDCQEIIKSRVHGLDQHGCPFAHYDRQKLSSGLLNLGISQSKIDQINQLVASKKYKKACAMYFNVVHDVEYFDSMCHPNEYFVKSKALGPKGVIKRIPPNIPDIEDIFASDSETI